MVFIQENHLRIDLKAFLFILIIISLIPNQISANYAIVEGKSYEFKVSKYEFNNNGSISNILELEDFSSNSIKVSQGENFTVIPLEVENRQNIPVDIDGLEIEIRNQNQSIEKFSPISGYDYFVDRNWNELMQFHETHNDTVTNQHGYTQSYKTVVSNETVFGFTQFSHTEQYGHPSENYTETRYLEAYFLKSSGIMIRQYRVQIYDGESLDLFDRKTILSTSLIREILGEDPPEKTTTIEYSSEAAFKIPGFLFSFSISCFIMLGIIENNRIRKL